MLGTINDNILYAGVSGFDNLDILAGRPYGGCAILWRSSLLVKVCPLAVDSKRICAVRISTDKWSLLVVNVYMPYEDDDVKTDEFVYMLSLIESMYDSNMDSHVVIGGDFNVDFGRNWTHTALLNSFCDSIGVSPVVRHAKCDIDYTYNFNMERFNILDHFLLSDTLFNLGVDSANVIHNVDNTSDHDPIVVRLIFDVKYIGLSKRVFAPRLSWVKADNNELSNYRVSLAQNLNRIVIPVEAILCCDLKCQDCQHHIKINQYSESITRACLMAGESSIPSTTDRQREGRIPGWSERVEPLRQKSIFWHGLWVECGRSRTGAVADCMRRTRASYHYAIRQVRKDEDNIIRGRVADALINDPGRDFWNEVKKMRNNKAANSRIVDGCTDENSISQVFASKYRDLYTSVPYDKIEMQNIITDVENRISDGALFSDYTINCHDVQEAISRLKSHKNDGNVGLSSDYFLQASADLAIHIAFLFTCIISHGKVPADLVCSTILPIPKNRNVSAVHSDSFRGIALSSIFGKLFDNIIVSKFYDKLSTSDLQFGFKQKSSTHMCTMVLKETVSYYVNNSSSVFCTFLDASKAFDRVNYCKLFRLLIKRGLPACIIRALIMMYTFQQVRISWSGIVSNYFNVLNGVKQGGVMSPILFCIYIDDLLIRLSQSGVGCYFGLSFVGAIAYADDIVLICPTPMAMRKLLSICDSYASEYDITFNAQKSKFLVTVAKNGVICSRI